MLGLAVGQEIEYQCSQGRNRWSKHRGRVVQVTDRHIAVQGPQYSDSIAICDLIRGQARITKPEVDARALQLVNRKEPELVGKDEPWHKWKERKAMEAAKEFEVFEPKKREKYDWAVKGPRALAMKADGKSTKEIAVTIGVPYDTTWMWLKNHYQEPSESELPVETFSRLGDDIQATEMRGKPLHDDSLDASTYLLRIISRFKAQQEKGIGKYGQLVEDNPASRDERLEHLAQELTDGLMYIEWLKEQPEKPMLGLPDVNWQKHGWTLPGQLKKVFEEAGEVAEAVANQNAMEILKEALDTMQTCKTMISMVLAVETWIDLAQLLADHTAKLERKGYL